MCKKLLYCFSAGEKLLWGGSVLLIAASFFLFGRGNYLALIASFIGITSLLYNAKGNPFGQLLMVLFSLLYGLISYTFSYYGEMATYLFMTAPMSAFALFSWLKNPYGENRAEVEIAQLQKRDIRQMLLLTAAVTLLFYFILRALHTPNLLLSTLSVATSFLAVYLTYKRSVLFALAYAANDLVLIALWALAALCERSYLSVLTCFILFFINDFYTFISWRRICRRQRAETP